VQSSPPALLPKLPPRERIGLRGLSGTMPPVNFPPPPSAPERQTIPPPPSRKITSPFSWLSRNTTEKKVASPPLPAVSPGHDRKNTNASLATIGSNPELMLSKIEDESVTDGSNNRSSQSSLRDRFKFLRMREEAGITSLEDENGQNGAGSGGALAGLVGRSASMGLGIASPESAAEEKEDKPPSITRAPSSPGLTTMKQPTINPNLAPGTAAGIAAGPASDSAAPVDWDLWQSVVYEGPAAVARTSPEELNQAIASGIPQAIRGVVWQVLAQSKNEELEGVYRELVARGTDKERVTIQLPHMSRENSGHATVNGKEKDSIASSSSSVHSDHSTPATTATSGTTNAAAGSPTTTGEQGPEVMVKLQAILAAEKKRKAKVAKEEAAALQKLEKAIKRDLGARTSYSKYVMSAGLQDGLFGVCKAYALFDEAVGYAQGMNFIAMPLLFNVGTDTPAKVRNTNIADLSCRCRKKKHFVFLYDS